MSEPDLPFHGKKRRIAERLWRGEDRPKIVKEEETIPNYVNNTAAEMHKLNIPIPEPEEENPTVAPTYPDETTLILDRGNVPESDLASPLEVVAPVDPELKALQDEDNRIISENVGKARRLKVLQQIDQHSKKGEQLDKDIHHEERRRWVKIMPYDFQDYANGMRISLRENPSLQARLDTAFTNLGYSSEFENNVDQVLEHQFQMTNHIASTFRWANGVKERVIDYPTPSSFPEDQWEFIIDELESEVRSRAFGKHIEKLEKLISLPFRCIYDNSNLRHAGGSDFTCARGHLVIVKCPDCGGPLNFDGKRFLCLQCLQRSFGM